MQLQNSERWHNQLNPTVKILDPDGWDRTNYQYSFFVEKITKEEYERRLILSTCLWKADKKIELKQVKI